MSGILRGNYDRRRALLYIQRIEWKGAVPDGVIMLFTEMFDKLIYDFLVA